ncbi:hypothetical protein GM182_00045 [bacterium 3DAC]|nr:hypothetical protein [Dictyoglomota bacterium]UZN22343.1 hypothetical protein GM182_00045 [bacterium 3DAC]
MKTCKTGADTKLTVWLKRLIAYMLVLMIPFGLAVAVQGYMQKNFGYLHDGMFMLTVPFLLWNIVMDGLGVKNMKLVSAGYWVLSVLAFLDIFVVTDDVFRILMLIISFSAIYGAIHPDWAMTKPKLKIK